MFQPTKIRKNVVSTAVTIKSIIQQITTNFIPKFLSFYNFITNLIPNLFNDEEGDLLMEKYKIASQHYEIASKFDIYANLKIKTIYNHKIYSDYLEVCDYKIIDNNYKFFLSKIYKNKTIHIRRPTLKTNIILDELFHVTDKLRFEFRRKSVKGSVVINKHYFFQNNWRQFLQKTHRLTYKIASKSKQLKSKMKLILTDLPKLNKLTQLPYKNKKLLKKKKPSVSNVKGPLYRGLDNGWLSVKKLEPFVKKKKINEIFNKKLTSSRNFKSKHNFTIKNIIKLQRIAIKSNNYKLYNSISSYKKKLLTKNLIVTQTTSWKKRKLKYFIKLNKQLRIRWNSNILFYNKFFYNITSTHNLKHYSRKVLLTSMYIKKKLKNSSFIFKNLKLFYLSSKIFKIKFLKKIEKKKIKNLFSNKLKKSLFLFYKFLKKTNQINNSVSYLNSNKTTYITFYNTYNTVVNKLSACSLSNKFNKKLNIDENLNILNFLKNYQIKSPKLNKALNKNNYNLNLHDSKNPLNQVLKCFKKSTIFLKKNNILKNNTSLFKNYFFLKHIIQVFYNYPEQFNKVLKHSITKQLSTTSNPLGLEKKSLKNIKSTPKLLISILKKKLSKLSKAHWLYKNYNKKFKKIKQLVILTSLVTSVSNLRHLNFKLNRLTKIHNYIHNKFSHLTGDFIKIDKNTLNVKDNYQKAIGYHKLISIYTKKLKKDSMLGIVDFSKVIKFKKLVNINKSNSNVFKVLNYFLTANTNLKKKYILFKFFFKKEFTNITKYSRELQLKKLYQWRFKLTKLIPKERDIHKVISFLEKISKNRKYFDAVHSLKSLKKKTKTIKNPRFKNPNLLTIKTERTKVWEDKLYKKWLFLRYKNVLIDNFKLVKNQQFNEKKNFLLDNKFLKKYFYHPFSEPLFTRKWKKLVVGDFSLPVIAQLQSMRFKSKINKKLLKKNNIKLLKKFSLLSSYKKNYLKKKTYLYLKKKKILSNLTLRKLALNSLTYRKSITLSIRKKNLIQLFKFKKLKKTVSNIISSKKKKKLETVLNKNNMLSILKYRVKKIQKKDINNKLNKVNVLNFQKYSKKKFNKLVFFSKQKKYLIKLIENKKISAIKTKKKNNVKQKNLYKILSKLKKNIIINYKKKKLEKKILHHCVSKIGLQRLILKIKPNKKNNRLINIKTLIQLNKFLKFKLTVKKLNIQDKFNIIYREYPLNCVFSKKNLKRKLKENIIKKVAKKKIKILCWKANLNYMFNLVKVKKVRLVNKIKKKPNINFKKNTKKKFKKKFKKNNTNKNKKSINKLRLNTKKLIYKRLRGDVKLQKKQQLWLNKKLLSKTQRNLTNIVLLNKNKVYTSKRAIQRVIKALKLLRARNNKTKNKSAKFSNFAALNKQNNKNNTQLFKSTEQAKIKKNTINAKKTSKQNLFSKKDNKLKNLQKSNKTTQLDKKQLIKKWTYNDLVLLNLGDLKPSTKNNRHSDIIKKNFTKIKNKQPKKYEGLLIQYENSDYNISRNSSRAARTLLKLHSQWSLNTPSVKQSSIKSKTKSTFLKLLKPVIQKKVKRTGLNNNFKLNIKKKITKTPKNVSHLVESISVLFDKYKKNFNQIIEKQSTKSIRFFFEKIKSYNFFKLFSSKEEKFAELTKNKKINFIKNYGRSKISKRQKNWIFIKKKILSKVGSKRLNLQKNLKKFKNLFKMVNKFKFYSVTNNKFLHTGVKKKLYRNTRIKYSLYQFTTQLSPEISYFMQTLKTIKGLIRTKFNNAKRYRLRRLKVISIMRKKRKLKKKLELKELLRISKLPKLPKLFKPKKRTGWKKLLRKNKIKKVKKMYFYKKLKKIQKKIESSDRVNKHKLEKHYLIKPQHIQSKTTLKDKKKIFSILVQIKKNNIVKAKYIINKSKNTLNKKKKNSLSLIIQKSYFYKIYNRLYKKNLIISQLKKLQQSSIFKSKINLIKKKKFIKIKSNSFNLKELVFLSKLVRISVKKNKKKKNKIVYKSLIKNINNSLSKGLNINVIKNYSKIHKLLNRRLTKHINTRVESLLYSGKTSQKKIKKYNSFFFRSQVLLNLKLHKKIRNIEYLVKIIKKKIKIIKKKKWKKIKKKWSNVKRLSLKRTYLLKKNIVLITKYNSLHNIPIVNIKLNVRNFIFLNKPAYESSLLNFYFKTITTKTNVERKNRKTLFFNFRNKKLTTYRKARQLHWKNVTHKKLNKRKYSKFIKKWVKNINSYWSTFKTHCMFKFNFSHQFWENFILLYRTVYNKTLEYKTISQLPIHTTFWWFLNLQKKLIQKVSLKLNFWQEKKIKIKKTFWMEQKKNLPKFIKKKLFRLYKSLSALHYDYITNCFIMLKNIQQPIHNNLYFINNKLLKLHDFKYKS